MTVHTDITQAHWTTFVRFVVRNVSRGPGGRLWRWVIVIAAGALVGVTFSTTGIGLHFPSLLVGAVGGTLWIVIISRLQMRRMIPPTDGYVLGPRHVTLSEDGVREDFQRHESHFRWHGVQAAQVTEQHVNPSPLNSFYENEQTVRCG